MKPAPFAYDDPRTLDEAVALLAEHGDEAKVLAGGQSLIPLLNFRIARPDRLVDINGVAALRYLTKRDDGTLAVGATTRMAALERSPLVAGDWPLIAEAARHVGHVQIRNRGTAGGSVAHADPAAELPAALLALDATAVARSASGRREIGLDGFFAGYLSTALSPDEILVELRVPAPPAGSGTALVEFARRPGDFALAGAACRVSLAGGALADLRVVVFGVGSRPLRLEAAEAALAGGPTDGGHLRRSLAAALEAVDAVSDIHGGAAYRRGLAAEMAARALELAIDRAAA